MEQPKITAAHEEPGLHEKMADNISGVFLQSFGEEDYLDHQVCKKLSSHRLDIEICLSLGQL